jgi:hypothetical protein
VCVIIITIIVTSGAALTASVSVSVLPLQTRYMYTRTGMDLVICDDVFRMLFKVQSAILSRLSSQNDCLRRLNMIPDIDVRC